MTEGLRQDAPGNDNAPTGAVRQPDRVRVLEEALSRARDLSGGDSRGPRLLRSRPRQERCVLLPGIVA